MNKTVYTDKYQRRIRVKDFLGTGKARSPT